MQYQILIRASQVLYFNCYHTLPQNQIFLSSKWIDQVISSNNILTIENLLCGQTNKYKLVEKYHVQQENTYTLYYDLVIFFTRGHPCTLRVPVPSLSYLWHVYNPGISAIFGLQPNILVYIFIFFTKFIKRDSWQTEYQIVISLVRKR